MLLLLGQIGLVKNYGFPRRSMGTRQSPIKGGVVGNLEGLAEKGLASGPEHTMAKPLNKPKNLDIVKGCAYYFCV